MPSFLIYHTFFPEVAVLFWLIIVAAYSFAPFAMPPFLVAASVALLCCFFPYIFC